MYIYVCVYERKTKYTRCSEKERGGVKEVHDWVEEEGGSTQLLFLYCSDILAFSYHQHVQHTQNIISTAFGTCAVPNMKPR